VAISAVSRVFSCWSCSVVSGLRLVKMLMNPFLGSNQAIRGWR
jgi:hypothetical protein